MSKDWPADLEYLHWKFGVHSKVDSMTPALLTELLKFRFDCLQEELDEGRDARDAETVVDSIIDLCVFAIGTLDLYKIDSHEAWRRVHEANLSKEVGIKHNRPNPFGLPDLIKPSHFVSPKHNDNVGLLNRIRFPLYEEVSF